jgi:hypothetical protein
VLKRTEALAFGAGVRVLVPADEFGRSPFALGFVLSRLESNDSSLKGGWVSVSLSTRF